MAKSTTTEVVESEQLATQPAPVNAEDTSLSDTPAPAVFEITLIEFMQKLSLRDRRVELVNAFYAKEKATGVVKAMESEFQSHFDAFTTMVIED